MNKNLMFRAWDDLNKKWLLGYDYENLGGFSMIGEVMIFGRYQGMINSFRLEDWDKIKLMQFTGLKDKNGKEIYEGDLLRVKNNFQSKRLDPKYYVDSIFKVNEISCTKGLSLRFVKTFIDDPNCQYPIVQYPCFEFKTLAVDYLNRCFDRIAILESVDYPDDAYSNDIEVIGNIYEHPELIAPNKEQDKTELL